MYNVVYSYHFFSKKNYEMIHHSFDTNNAFTKKNYFLSIRKNIYNYILD